MINAHWIKPLDRQTLEFFARGAEVVCTSEDHVLANDYGCAVIEALSEDRITTPRECIGWPDEFIEHGTVHLLLTKHGVTPENAAEKNLAELQNAPPHPTPRSGCSKRALRETRPDTRRHNLFLHFLHGPP